MQENNDSNVINNTTVKNEVSKSPSSTPPTPSECSMGKLFQVHTALILNNLGIFTCIIGILLFFSFLIPPLYFTLMLLLTLCTAGTIFLIIPNFKDWWEYSSVLADNVEMFVPISKWILGASIVLSVLSLILMLTNKDSRKMTRVTSCIIIIIISTIALIIRLLNLLGV